MWRASRSLSMNRMLEKNIHLVAEHGQGLSDGTDGKLKHRSSVDANRSHAPGIVFLFNVNDNPFPVKVHSVDGEAHGECVDTVGRVNPQSLAAGEAGRVGGHEAAKAGPVSARDQEIGCEVGGACVVKSVSLGPSHGDIESLS